MLNPQPVQHRLRRIRADFAVDVAFQQALDLQFGAEGLGEIFEYVPKRLVLGLIGIGGVFPFRRDGGQRALC